MKIRSYLRNIQIHEWCTLKNLLENVHTVKLQRFVAFVQKVTGLVKKRLKGLPVAPDSTFTLITLKCLAEWIGILWVIPDGFDDLISLLYGMG